MLQQACWAFTPLPTHHGLQGCANTSSMVWVPMNHPWHQVCPAALRRAGPCHLRKAFHPSASPLFGGAVVSPSFSHLGLHFKIVLQIISFVVIATNLWPLKHSLMQNHKSKYRNQEYNKHSIYICSS